MTTVTGNGRQRCDTSAPGVIQLPVWDVLPTAAKGDLNRHIHGGTGAKRVSTRVLGAPSRSEASNYINQSPASPPPSLAKKV